MMTNPPTSVFDAEYFIRKFEAIPEDQWCRYNWTNANGQHCALGHCEQLPGLRGFSPEQNALVDLFRRHQRNIVDVNDRLDLDFGQATPRDRVMAALRTMQNRMEVWL